MSSASALPEKIQEAVSPQHNALWWSETPLERLSGGKKSIKMFKPEKLNSHHKIKLLYKWELQIVCKYRYGVFPLTACIYRGILVSSLEFSLNIFSNQQRGSKYPIKEKDWVLKLVINPQICVVRFYKNK